MPGDNKEAYKEMYEMGERLMQMAKDGGYSPDDSSDMDDEDSEMDYSDTKKDKVGTALSMFGNG